MRNIFITYKISNQFQEQKLKEDTGDKRRTRAKVTSIYGPLWCNDKCVMIIFAYQYISKIIIQQQQQQNNTTQNKILTLKKN